MNDLQVAGTQIRRDAEGKYCLNDLHRAAGAEVKHEPHRWIRNEQTKALIRAFDNKIITTKFGGNNEKGKAGFPAYSKTHKSGTFVVKQLVYAYAMWISPEFHLAVIEAYDALVNGELRGIMQAENYWFARRPLWPPIRRRVLASYCYSDIATALGISRARVARAVRSMIRVGLLAPWSVVVHQTGPARRAALRNVEGWGIRQLSLFDNVQPA